MRRVARRLCSRRSAWTVIELIVSVAILGALLSLMIPALFRVRSHALDTKSLTSLRTHSTAVAMYTNDFRDSLLVLGMPGPQGFVLYDRGRYRPFNRYFEGFIAWVYLIDDLYYEGDPNSDVFYPSDAVAKYGKRGDGAPFYLTCTMFAQPDYWNLYTRTGLAQHGQTFMHQVAYPAQKILMYSRFEFEPDDLTSLSGPSIPVVHNRFDGSASIRMSREVRPGVRSGEGNYPGTIHHLDEHQGGLHTVDGLRGIDLSP